MKASVVYDDLPILDCKDTKKFGKSVAFGRKTEKKWRFIWNLNEKSLSLQRQNNILTTPLSAGSKA
jgi:hypothetical protein